jgi:hypothetical protein
VNKFVMLLIMWAVIIFGLLITTAAMPAINSIVDTSVTNIEATSNTSNYPGFIPALESSPIWLYLIFPVCGIIATVWVLKSGDRE